MFEVTDQRCTLVSVNPRSERHGEEAVAAADIGLQFDAANEMLSFFGPRLLDSLYYKDRKPSGAAGQGELAVVEPISSKPDLKNACIDGNIRIVYEGVGYKCEVDFGLGGSSNIVLESVAVNNIRVLCKQGGTVQFSVRVQVSNPTPAQIGILATMVGHEITVSLDPPQASPQLAA